MRESRYRAALQLIAASAFVMVCGAMTSTLAQPMGPSGQSTGIPFRGVPLGGAPNAEPRTPDALVASMPRWDVDHDGAVTCEEWKQYADRLFTVADKNRDGVLDDKEFSQLDRLEPAFSGADMSYFDDNNDKRVSRSEFVDKPSPIFALYDTNHDCRVTKEEIKGSATPASDKSAAPRRRMGRGGGAGQSGF